MLWEDFIRCHSGGGIRFTIVGHLPDATQTEEPEHRSFTCTFCRSVVHVESDAKSADVQEVQETSNDKKLTNKIVQRWKRLYSWLISSEAGVLCGPCSKHSDVPGALVSTPHTDGNPPQEGLQSSSRQRYPRCCRHLPGRKKTRFSSTS